MAKQFAWIVVAALGMASGLSAEQAAEQATQQPPQQQKASNDARPQDPNRWKWWINPEHRKELGITDAQSAEINRIFESTFPAQRIKQRERDELERTVAKLLKEYVADVATVSQQVERLEKLDADIAINRTVMLYRINLVLTPEQRDRLEAFRKRREENRRKSDHR